MLLDRRKVFHQEVFIVLLEFVYFSDSLIAQCFYSDKDTCHTSTNPSHRIPFIDKSDSGDSSRYGSKTSSGHVKICLLFYSRTSYGIVFLYCFGFFGLFDILPSCTSEIKDHADNEKISTEHLGNRVTQYFPESAERFYLCTIIYHILYSIGILSGSDLIEDFRIYLSNFFSSHSSLDERMFHIISIFSSLQSLYKSSGFVGCNKASHVF